MRRRAIAYALLSAALFGASTPVADALFWTAAALTALGVGLHLTERQAHEHVHDQHYRRHSH